MYFCDDISESAQWVLFSFILPQVLSATRAVLLVLQAPWCHRYSIISFLLLTVFIKCSCRPYMKNISSFPLSFKDNQVLNVKTHPIFFSVRIKIQVKELTYLALCSTGIFIIQIYSLEDLLFMFVLFAFIKCLALYIFLLCC